MSRKKAFPEPFSVTKPNAGCRSIRRSRPHRPPSCCCRPWAWGRSRPDPGGRRTQSSAASMISWVTATPNWRTRTSNSIKRMKTSLPPTMTRTRSPHTGRDERENNRPASKANWHRADTDQRDLRRRSASFVPARWWEGPQTTLLTTSPGEARKGGHRVRGKATVDRNTLVALMDMQDVSPPASWKRTSNSRKKTIDFVMRPMRRGVVRGAADAGGTVSTRGLDIAGATGAGGRPDQYRGTA